MRCSIIVEGYGGSPIFSSTEFHADRLTELLGTEVHFGYAHMGEPTMQDALGEVSSEDPDALVVVPLYYAPGDYTDGDTMKRFNADPATRRGKFDLEGREVDVYVARMFITEPGMKDVVRNVVSKVDKDTGIILVGHGSQDGRNQSMVRPFADALREDGYDVLSGSNEFDEDTVESMVSAMAARHGRIAVLPMFISPNHHSRVDVPPKLGLAEKQTSGKAVIDGKEVQIDMLPEIGTCPELTPLLLNTVRDSGFL